MTTPADLYGSMVFNDHVMKDRLPSETYRSFRNTVEQGKPLSFEDAQVIAEAMKDWAVEQGATHFTHWFQPLTGITSEKHDAFLTPMPDGSAIMTFSGKELIQGEPDASSFPSGGLRATFEARGYTAWDPTSFAFIKDGVLCIPTAFASYNGEALDKKTPLLRSVDALSQQAVKVMALFGVDVPRVIPMCGPEQEYFLIPRPFYEARQDLMITGRTLFGAAPCKGQELSEHYFGSIRHTVLEFMKEVDEELWKLGVSACTRHNEVAPTQHELAVVYSDVNTAIDHNLLTMEVLRKVARAHNLVCLQHEKPFAGINGSGKHNNWSLAAGEVNLLNPGDTALEKLRFMVFLTSVIKAVDEYQDLLRASVASAGNDRRLGADEAPPAIISIFLGDQLTMVVDALIAGGDYTEADPERMDLGVATLPALFRDNTDRNRTSPFAFTGNKFEFRMPGSSINLSDANMVINTAVAKTLKDYLDAVAPALEDGASLEDASWAYIRKTLADHRRILFDGNGYSDDWIQEAQRRGLTNFPATPDALPSYLTQKNLDLFAEFGVLNRAEVESRYEVALEQYDKVLNIEGKTMSHMTRRKIAPAVTSYAKSVAEAIVQKKAACSSIDCAAEEKLLDRLNDGTNAMEEILCKLDAAIQDAQDLQHQERFMEAARVYHDQVLDAMEELRVVTDEMEGIVSTEAWPLPTYNKILFY